VCGTSTRDVIGLRNFPTLLVRQALSRLALPGNSRFQCWRSSSFPEMGLTASSFHGLAVTGAAVAWCSRNHPNRRPANPLPGCSLHGV